ncbi:hypothetical protein ACFQL0_08030 [Haloplanus litoreus]|uniref:DUF7283 family protein n=1 Tax=Haloplanus litoreus TaxID=767515 RepID=UPI003623F6C1
MAGTSAPVTAEHPLDAREIRVEPNELGLRNDAGTTHATFAFGPVTPVGGARALTAILRGHRRRHGTPRPRRSVTPQRGHVTDRAAGGRPTVR